MEQYVHIFLSFLFFPLLTRASRCCQPKERQGGDSATYAKASVSNYHQSTTSYVNNDQFDDLPPIQRAVLEYMRAHKPTSEEGHHVRTLAKGVQHITKEPADVAYVVISRIASMVGLTNL